MRLTGTLIAGLLLLFGLDTTNAFEPDPLAFACAAQEEKEAKEQDKGEQKETQDGKSEKKDSAEASSDKKAEEKKEEEEKEEVVETPALDAVRALAEEYTASMNAFMKKTRSREFMKGFREAQKDGREAATEYLASMGQPDRARYAAEMGEVVAYSLAWTAANGDTKARRAAMDYLFANHADSEAIALIADRAGFGVPRKTAETRFRTLIKKNPHERVKGLATMSLADLLARNAKGDDTQEIEELYQTVIDKYASLETARGAIGERAKDALFELQHLSVGKEAPEITAEDLDGVEFKLTDYRGKVVLLDFWGNW